MQEQLVDILSLGGRLRAPNPRTGKRRVPGPIEYSPALISLRAHLLVYFSDRHGEDQLGPTRIGVGVRNVCFRHRRATRWDD